MRRRPAEMEHGSLGVVEIEILRLSDRMRIIHFTPSPRDTTMFQMTRMPLVLLISLAVKGMLSRLVSDAFSCCIWRY
jgi:hypothetical protein